MCLENLSSILHFAWLKSLRIPPPTTGVDLVVIFEDAPSLWKAASTWADVWVHVWGGAKYASKVKLWSAWFCLDGGDEHTFREALMSPLTSIKR